MGGGEGGVVGVGVVVVGVVVVVVGVGVGEGREMCGEVDVGREWWGGGVGEEREGWADGGAGPPAPTAQFRPPAVKQ